MHSVSKTDTDKVNVKALIKPGSAEYLVPPLLLSSESLSQLVLYLVYSPLY